MQSYSSRQIFAAFLLCWFILNVVQAVFTELHPDEAYYWMYSKHLDWGYFDHPPAVALIIKLGSTLLPGKLGIRLFVILMMLGTFGLLWKMSESVESREKTLLLISLLSAMPMFHIYGFIATPDAPLIFFGALYFFLYRRFVNHTSWSHSILLGICMALLLYSKYHGIFLILLILLSDIKILRNPRFYLASALGMLLYIPHLWWQWQHDFPSFRYHLSGRDDVYEIKYTLNYLLNQVVIFSPLLFPFIIRGLIRFRFSAPFQKSWRYVILGFWLLFLLLTSKGHVEPHWTALSTIPVVLLLFQAVQMQILDWKWTIRLSMGTLFMIAVVRILLMFTDLDFGFKKGEWEKTVETAAKGLPVVFIDSYSDPARYTFYSGHTAYTLTDVYYRENQYDLWRTLKELHNNSVCIIAQSDLECEDSDILQWPERGVRKLILADSFQVTQDVAIEFSIPETILLGKEYETTIKVKNPYGFDIERGKGDLPVDLCIILTDAWQNRQFYPVESDWRHWKARDEASLSVTYSIPEYKGGKNPVKLQWGVRTGCLNPTYNSRSQTITLSHDLKDEL